MTSGPLKILKDMIKTLDRELFSSPMSLSFPRQGMTTEEQIEQLPVLRRAMVWDQGGRLFVTEVRHCEMTGTYFRRVREVQA